MKKPDVNIVRVRRTNRHMSAEFFFWDRRPYNNSKIDA